MPRGKYKRVKKQSNKQPLNEAALEEAFVNMRKHYEEAPIYGGFRTAALPPATPNPKTFMGAMKVPMLSVIPPASLIYQAVAMRYGAYIAKRADGGRGYGPYNWRDQPVEVETYVDAAMRHLLQFQDGDEWEVIKDDNGEVIGRVPHLGFAIATIGVLIDAIENGTVKDNRPRVRNSVATHLLEQFKQPEKK